MGKVGRPKGIPAWNKGKKCAWVLRRNLKDNPMKYTSVVKKRIETFKRNGKLLIPRESRSCSCGCGTQFVCKVNAGRKFISGHNSRCRNEVVREKLRVAVLKRISEGKFVPSWAQCKKGWFSSVKNGQSLFYSSSYELLAFQLLESMVMVRRYEVGSCRIPYMFNGREHIYIVDLYVEYVNGERQLIEVKSASMLKDSKVGAKLEAGKLYAQRNHIRFSVWTESILVKQ